MDTAATKQILDVADDLDSGSVLVPAAPDGLFDDQDDQDEAHSVLRGQRARARRVEFAAATCAGIVGAAPINVSDRLIITPIQVAMVNGISQAYGRPPAIKDIGAVASVVLGDAAAAAGTSAAKTAAARVFKNVIARVPLAGPLLNCGIAVAGTMVMGEVWIAVCEYARAHDVEGLEVFLESPLGHDIRDRAMKAARERWMTSSGGADVMAQLGARLKQQAAGDAA
jgi:uncharacterized protein (DUF697 family)